MTHIGTAGWSIPPRYKESLPGGGSQLERYAQRLNAVEINSSFHRHHRLETYQRWSSSVPMHFRFSVKIPRTITHDSALTDASDVLDRFIHEVRGLGDKLGVLLVQIPPRIAFDEPTVTQFFNTLQERIHVQVACEPRHASWGSSRANAVLEHCAVARVASDPAPWPGAGEPGGFRGFAYFRWHGQPRKYYSEYDVEHVESLRKQVVAAGATAADVWVFFDNTVLGHALGNALALSAATACSHMHAAP
jgi:uncharacterized protein YecE (DUF72 family)